MKAKCFTNGPEILLSNPITEENAKELYDSVVNEIYRYSKSGVDEWLKGKKNKFMGFVVEKDKGE